MRILRMNKRKSLPLSLCFISILGSCDLTNSDKQTEGDSVSSSALDDKKASKKQWDAEFDSLFSLEETFTYELPASINESSEVEMISETIEFKCTEEAFQCGVEFYYHSSTGEKMYSYRDYIITKTLMYARLKETSDGEFSDWCIAAHFDDEHNPFPSSLAVFNPLFYKDEAAPDLKLLQTSAFAYEMFDYTEVDGIYSHKELVNTNVGGLGGLKLKNISASFNDGNLEAVTGTIDSESHIFGSDVSISVYNIGSTTIDIPVIEDNSSQSVTN